MACLTARRYHQHHRHRHHNHHRHHRHHHHHHHHHHLEHSFRDCLSQYWDIDSDSHGSWSAPFALLQQAILCYNGPWGTFSRAAYHPNQSVSISTNIEFVEAPWAWRSAYILTNHQRGWGRCQEVWEFQEHTPKLPFLTEDLDAY